MDYSAEILAALRENNSLLRTLIKKQVGEQGSDVDTEGAMEIICITNSRMMKKLRPYFMERVGDKMVPRFFRRGKKYYYDKKWCHVVKEKINRGDIRL